MFRAIRLPQRALLSASAAAAAGVVVLETPQQREKLSIYPSPTSEIVLLETPSQLETQIGVARRKVTEAYRGVHGQVQELVSRWIGVEHAVESRVKAIISPDESLTPGLLYVGISTLTGSIFARNRGLPTRFLLPPTFLLLSLHQFLPKTTANLSSYVGSIEETYFPAFSQKHDIANAHTRMAWERIKDATEGGRDWLNRRAENALDKAQESTGLKLRETLGWKDPQSAVPAPKGKIAQIVEQKVEEAKSVVEHNTEEAKVVVEAKVDEIVEKVEKKVEDIKRLV